MQSRFIHIWIRPCQFPKIISIVVTESEYKNRQINLTQLIIIATVVTDNEYENRYKKLVY